MKIIYLILFQIVMLYSCNSTKLNKKQPIENYFKVEVVQDGKVIIEKNDIIKLEKKAFKFKLTFINTHGVVVSNSWDKNYYDYPDNESIFKCDEETEQNNTCKFASGGAGAGALFNTEKTIVIRNKSNNDYTEFFYNEKADFYFMDKGVSVKEGIVYAEVTVENIIDIDKQVEMKYEKSEYNYPIEKISKDIYVVFATRHYKKGIGYTEELQREKFILKFK